MTKKRKFGVALADLENPMPPLTKGMSFDEDADRVTIEEYTKIEKRKMVLLQMHYGLELGDYIGLSLALAREFVEGFKEAKPKGRRKKWDELTLAYLFVEINRKISELELNKKEIKAAATEVAKQPHWAQKVGRSSPGSACTSAS